MNIELKIDTNSNFCIYVIKYSKTIISFENENVYCKSYAMYRLIHSQLLRLLHQKFCSVPSHFLYYL